MNPRCSGQLGQTADCILHFAGRHHHKVRKLIYNNHNLRNTLRSSLSFRNAHTFNFFIILLQVAHIILRKSIIAAHHFRNRPIQRPRRLLRICDHRNEQMRNPIVYAQLHYFGVNHDQFHILRRGFIKNTYNQSINAYRFTGSCSPCNQKMRHLGNIRHHRFSSYIFSNRKGKLGFRTLKFLGLNQFPQHYRVIFLIGNLNPHSSLSRDRRLDTDIRSRQVQFDVVRQSNNTADLNSHFRLKFISGYSRAAAYICHRYIYAEIVQCFLQLLRCLSKMGV